MGKICIKCKLEYDERFFDKGKNACKKCRKLQNEQRIKDREFSIKTCKRCGFTGIDEFTKGRGICKKCEKQLDINKIEKICTVCDFIGEYKLFVKGTNLCKKCKKENDNRYRQNHKNKIKEYKIKNKKRDNERNKNRLKNDHVYYLMHQCSHSVCLMLSKNNSSKNGKSSRRYFPFTKEELKLHIEKQFSNIENLDNNGKVWMNWNNRGMYVSESWDDNDSATWKWQLDHIIPHSKLPYSSMEEENFKKCWTLSNLRPYSAKQNLIDGNRR